MSYDHGDYSKLASTMLKQFADDVGKYHGYYEARTESPPDLMEKSNVKIGDLVHQVLLDKKEIADVVTPYPADCLNKAGNLNPKPAAKFRELMASQGMVAVKDSEFKRIVLTCNAALAHNLGALLTHSQVVFEEPIYWTDSATGLECRAKPDFMYEGEDTITCYDLKVSETVRPKEWQRTAKRLRYYIQACHYSSGLTHILGKPVEFVFWVLESRWPFRIARYEFDPISMERGFESYAAYMKDLAARKASGEWDEAWTTDKNYVSVEAWDVQPEEELTGFDDQEDE